MTPVAVMGNISGCPGDLLVRRRGRRAAVAGLLHLLQPIGEEPRGELRHIVVVRLRQLRGALHAVPQDGRRRVNLLPQPRTVHQQRRGVLLRQVRVLRRVVGRRDPGDRAASQDVTLTQTEDTSKDHRQGKVTDRHEGLRGRSRPTQPLFTSSRVRSTRRFCNEDATAPPSGARRYCNNTVYKPHLPIWLCFYFVRLVLVSSNYIM